MKTNVLSAILLLLLVSASLMGCSKQAPDALVDEAMAALVMADSVEADLYVADLFTAAADSFQLAQMELETQTQSADPVYDRAVALLQSAVGNANEAAAQVEPRKEAMRVETDTLLAQVQLSLAELKDVLARTPAGQSTIVPASITTDVPAIETTITDASAAQASGDVARANQLVRQAIDQTTSLLQTVSGPAPSTPSL